jgi:hypothetical protein
VKQSLKDPDSAKFNSYYRSFGDGVGYICGTVNVKNSYGGYVADRNYHVHLSVENNKIIDNSPVKIMMKMMLKVLVISKSICQ